MVERLRDREEWILATIIAIAAITIAGAVAAAFGTVDEAPTIVAAILGFGGTTLAGLFAALKVDKAENNISSATTQAVQRVSASQSESVQSE